MTSNLDTAFLGMQSGQEADAFRYYQILAKTPLFLVLDHEAEDETITPRLFDLQSGAMVLAFETEDRLAAWAADTGLGTLPYAMLPGRIIAQQLAPLNVALGLNFGAASQTILPSDAMEWLSQMLDVAPEPVQARIDQVLPLGSVPAALLAALDLAMTGAAGLASAAYLALARYQSGGQGHIVAICGAAPQAEPALTRAIAEALVFAGLEAGALDVTFVPSGSKLADILAHLGHRITIPDLTLADAPPPRPAPGADPTKPPRLK